MSAVQKQNHLLWWPSRVRMVPLTSPQGPGDTAGTPRSPIPRGSKQERGRTAPQAPHLRVSVCMLPFHKQNPSKADRKAELLVEAATAPYPAHTMARAALRSATTVASVTLLKSESYSCTKLPGFQTSHIMHTHSSCIKIQ